MNWDTVKGQWKQFRGQVKEQWGKLTDDDLDRIEGKRDQLLGAVQKRYGVARDEAERQLREFESAQASELTYPDLRCPAQNGSIRRRWPRFRAANLLLLPNSSRSSYPLGRSL